MERNNVKKQVEQGIEAVQQAAPQTNLSYFAELWTAFLTGPPQHDLHYIAVLGTGIPEIYLRACGLVPIYLFGGSFFSNASTDEIFPPISDPTIKSATGLLVSKEIPLLNSINTVAISAPNIDTLKIQAYLRAAGYSVLALDREPIPHQTMPSFYRDMQMNFLLQVEAVAGNAPSIEELLYEADLETRAHYALHRLDETDLPQLIKTFVRQSYYIAADREAWLWQLELLIQQSGPSAGEALLLIGSPISFPNMKIPNVLQEVHITHYRNRCSTLSPQDYSALFQNPIESLPELLEQLHQIHYSTCNSDIYAFYPEDLRGISGVVFHLLKGQVNWAFEAEKMEKRAIRLGIPFLCVETDYSDADHEQVKVRIEGFSELLQKKYGKEITL